jgi:hypothetical protein
MRDVFKKQRHQYGLHPGNVRTALSMTCTVFWLGTFRDSKQSSAKINWLFPLINPPTAAGKRISPTRCRIRGSRASHPKKDQKASRIRNNLHGYPMEKTKHLSWHKPLLQFENPQNSWCSILTQNSSTWNDEVWIRMIFIGLWTY